MEEWQAGAVVGVACGEGGTRPLQVTCFRRRGDGGRETHDFWVTAPGHPEVDGQSLFAEYAGAWLAREVGVGCPGVALVRISAPFAMVANSLPAVRDAGITLSEGTGVGVRYSRGLVSFRREERLQLAPDLKQAAHLYAFDLLARNTGRSAEASWAGLARRAGDLLALGFGRCFRGIEQDDAPWHLDAELARGHLLFPSLSGKINDFSGFRDRLRALDVPGLETSLRNLPAAWTRSQIRPLAAYLRRASEHADDLVAALERVLR